MVSTRDQLRGAWKAARLEHQLVHHEGPAHRHTTMWDFEDYAVQHEDKRAAVAGAYGTSTHFLVNVITIYLLIVLIIGRIFMLNRSPFKITGILVVYNLIQVALNSYYITRMMRIFSWEDSNFWCQPLWSDRMDEKGMEAFYMTYFFYCLKVMDLMDTIFFVVRKKWNQVTFLHVYHHVATLCVLWTAVRMFPGGPSFITSSFNAGVHCIMYTYYLLAALHLPGVFIIKPYITMVQLVQFVLNVSHMLYSTLFGTCQSSHAFQYTVVALNTSMLVLFFKFYRQSYGLRREGHRGFIRKVM